MFNLRSHYGLVYILLNMLTAFSLANVIAAIYMVFLLDNGLSNIQALTISAVFHIGVFVFELPTGVLADVYGKKVSVMIGYGLWAAGQMLYVLGNGFSWFVGAELVAAIGLTFISGALDAWMIEKVGDENSKSVLARSGLYTKLAVIGAGVTGGLVAQYFGMRMNFAIEAVVAVMAILFVFVFMEADTVHKHTKEGLALLISSFQDTWKHFIENPKTVQTALFTTLSWFFIMPVFSFWQPNFKQGGFTTFELGITFGLFSLAMSIGSWVLTLKAFQERTSEWSVLAIAAFLKAVGAGGAAWLLGVNAWFAVGMLLIFEIAFGMFIPQTISLFNTGLPNKYRAGLNSLHSLINKVGTVSSLFIFGFIADRSGQILPWSISAIGFAGITILAIWMSIKEKKD